MEIIQNMFSDHNGMKSEINNRRIFGKFTNTWKLINILLNNQQVKEESKVENHKVRPGAVTHTCNPRILGGQGG